jgi:cob(I)alamin adenosyltransferase
MTIVTKTGDGGETGLVGGSRVPKSDIRLHAYGTVDELNAFLGAVLAGDVSEPIRAQLGRLQHLLFRLGADLASPKTVTHTKRIEPAQTKEIEGWIAALESSLPPLDTFILPGGSRVAAQLHVARTVCRRAERWAVALSEFEDVNQEALIFLNRLGDYLFLAARETNRAAGGKEVIAEY